MRVLRREPRDGKLDRHQRRRGVGEEVEGEVDGVVERVMEEGLGVVEGEVVVGVDEVDGDDDCGVQVTCA